MPSHLAQKTSFSCLKSQQFSVLETTRSLDSRARELTSEPFWNTLMLPYWSRKRGFGWQILLQGMVHDSAILFPFLHLPEISFFIFLGSLELSPLVPMCLYGPLLFVASGPEIPRKLTWLLGFFECMGITTVSSSYYNYFPFLLPL